MFVNKCRICLFDQTDNVPLFESKRNDQSTLNNLGQMYRDCLQLELTINVGYPEHICKYCSLQLTEFHNFLLNARHSFEQFAASEVSPLMKSKKLCSIPTVKEVKHPFGFHIEAAGHKAMQESGLHKTEIPRKHIKQNDEENDVIIVEDEAENMKQEEFDEHFTFPEIHVLDESDNEEGFDSSEMVTKINKFSSNHFLCKLCGQKFLTQHMYQAHMNEHKGLPKFTCELCSSSLNSRSGYRKHMLKHWNGYVPCEGCYKALRSSSVLPKDIRIKTPPPTYQCKVCRSKGKYPLNHDQWPFSNFPKGKRSI